MLKQTFSKTGRADWRDVFYAMIVQKDAIRVSALRIAKKSGNYKWN
jgi:hypothetical protein